MDEFDKLKETLIQMNEENIKFSTDNQLSNNDGMLLRVFRASLTKTEYNDENDDEGVELEVASIDGGCVIPSFMMAGEGFGYDSLFEICDSISGDMLSAYTFIYNDEEEIKQEILDELKIEMSEAIDFGILFMHGINAVNLSYLDMLLTIFEEVEDLLPTKYCSMAATLINIEQEPGSVDIFLNHKWLVKALDDKCRIAYCRI